MSTPGDLRRVRRRVRRSVRLEAEERLTTLRVIEGTDIGSARRGGGTQGNVERHPKPRVLQRLGEHARDGRWQRTRHLEGAGEAQRRDRAHDLLG